jgi:hypothetical protein
MDDSIPPRVATEYVKRSDLRGFPRSQDTTEDAQTPTENGPLSATQTRGYTLLASSDDSSPKNAS